MSDKTSTDEQPQQTSTSLLHRTSGLLSLILGAMERFKTRKANSPFCIVKEPRRLVTKLEPFLLMVDTKTKTGPEDYVRVELQKAQTPAAKKTKWATAGSLRGDRLAYWKGREIAAFALSLSDEGTFRIKIEVVKDDKPQKDDIVLATLYTNRFATPEMQIPQE